MTLKGRKNHYNVKLLRGYGVSISLKDNKIHLKNGIDIISGKSETESWFITQLPYEKIVISGKGYISTDAIRLLNQNNRNVVLVDTYGKPVSFMNGMMESLTATKYRMAQYDVFRDPVKCLYLQRQTVKSKLESQINFLKSTKNELVNNGIIQLEGYLKQIENHLLGVSFNIDHARVAASKVALLASIIRQQDDNVSFDKLRYDSSQNSKLVTMDLSDSYSIFNRLKKLQQLEAFHYWSIVSQM